MGAPQSGQKSAEGLYDEAANTIQELINDHVTDESEKGWYLEEIARCVYRSSKTKSNSYQVTAHKKNRYLLKPREGMVFQKIAPLSQKRVDIIIEKVRQFARGRQVRRASRPGAVPGR